MNRETDRFRDWLIERGAVVLEPTNPYEVVRFRTPRDVGIVYRNKRGEHTYVGEAEDAHRAFVAGREWKATDRTRRDPMRKVKIALIARDGAGCVYCGVGLTEETATVEHVVPVAKKGPNHMHNLMLACQPCNAEVADMTVVEKVRYRDRKLGLR